MQPTNPQDLLRLKDFAERYPQYGGYQALRARLRRLQGTPGFDKCIVHFGRSVLISPRAFVAFLTGEEGRA